MRRNNRLRRKRASRGPTCFGLLLRASVLLLLLIVLYFTLARPQLSQFVAEQVVRQSGLQPVATTTLRSAAPRATPGTSSGDDAPLVPSDVAGRVADVVEALPSGTLEVTEDQANAFLQANPDAVAPLDEVRVRFVPGQVVVEVRGFGLSSEASAGLAADNGQLVVVNPQISGPIGLILSPEELVEPVTAQLNASLAEQGQRVQDVRIEQGKITVTIE